MIVVERHRQSQISLVTATAMHEQHEEEEEEEERKCYSVKA
jgi:hypothetical protein